MKTGETAPQNHRVNHFPVWISHDWACCTVSVLLILAPVIMIISVAIGDISYGGLSGVFGFHPLGLFGFATVTSLIIGINRFTKWMPQSVNLCGCIIAFLLCALAAVRILMLIAGISIFSTGFADVAEEHKIQALMFCLYAGVNLLGAVQSSEGSRA